MIEILSHFFGAVCGQNLGHTWAPGGVPLPCCQRCTGLYVGAGMAALLHSWLRPKLSGWFLEIHGAFFLMMAPFGFHWVPQEAALRTLTGVLFGFAVVTFLWLPLRGMAGEQSARSNPKRGCDADGAGETPALRWPQTAAGLYFLVLGATLILLPATAALGGASVAYLLSCLAFCGALALVALVVADVSFGVAWVVRR